MKFLIIRTDKIGDVMLSLPVAQTLRQHVPDAEIHMMVREPITDLIAGHPSIDRVMPYNNKRMANTIRAMRNERFDAAILLHPTLPLSLELFLSGIPRRVGTGFRWYSFLFNRRVYEHRKPSEKHEISYNLHMLKPLGIDKSRTPPTLVISESEKEKVRTLLESNGIDWRNFILVHPGSGGSTLPWPEQNYRELVSLLAHGTDLQLVLTGSADERKVTERFKVNERGRIADMAGRTSLTELAGIISLARLFIGNSTGPMHIASATGTPVITFFPPSRANRKTRWAPLTPSIVFEPPVPYCRRCIREKCQYYNCMELIKPEYVFKRIREWLKNETTG